MKKAFNSAEIEIVKFDIDDVIATSGEPIYDPGCESGEKTTPEIEIPMGL